MGSAALPLDVVVLIMAISQPTEISACMRSCRALRQHGAKLLLDDGVALSTPKHAISFLKFMFADAEFRFQHLHVLEVSSFPGDASRALNALYALISHPLLDTPIQGQSNT